MIANRTIRSLLHVISGDIKLILFYKLLRIQSVVSKLHGINPELTRLEVKHFYAFAYAKYRYLVLVMIAQHLSIMITWCDTIGSGKEYDILRNIQVRPMNKFPTNVLISSRYFLTCEYTTLKKISSLIFLSVLFVRYVLYIFYISRKYFGR